MSAADASGSSACERTERSLDAFAALLVDQREHWQRGERILAETYLERFPALRDAPEATLDLIYHEMLLREQRGESPRLEEYQQRFPQFAEELGAQFDVHRAIESGLPSDSTLVKREGVAPATDFAVSAPRANELRIPGYEILHELGRGGMGVVYCAWEESLLLLVAIKMLQTRGPTAPQDLARFRTEAEAVAKLDHANIVRIYKVGESNGCPYIVLQFVDGGTLAQKLTGTPWPAREAAELLKTLADAMHYAHQRRIIHRDLTPSNVLLTRDGVPKITDFGLAKLLVGGTEQTQSGDILGTPSYMAPEQAGGKVREISPATDVYALGVILYEMLTGRPPFRAATMLETLEQARSQVPVPPARLQPKVPRDVETICLKCLQKEPRKRYASAEELADDLGCFLTDKPIRARRTGLFEHSWRWCRRNPAVAALLGSVALLLVAITAASLVAAALFGNALDRAQRAEEETNRLWDSYLSQGRAIRAGPQVGQRHEALKALTQVAARRPSLELRNDAIALMTLTDLRKTQEWPVAPEGTTVRGSVFDVHLERHAWSDEQGNIRIRRVGDNQDLKLLPGPGSPAWVLEFSPEGRFLAAKHHPWGDERQVQFRVWDVARGELILQQVPFKVCQRAFAFSPDCRWLTVGGEDGGIRLYDLRGDHQGKDGLPVARNLAQIPYPARLAFDLTGQKLAVASMSTAGELQVLDVISGHLVDRLRHPRACRALAWHPGGKRLAVGCNDHQVFVWDVAAERKLPALRDLLVWDWAPAREPLILRGHEAEVVDILFNHRGDLLVSTSYVETLFWDSRTGKLLLRAPKLTNPQFQRDDRVLGVAGSSIALWEVTAGRECRVLHGHTGDKGPWSVDYSPDGRFLVSASNDGMRIWDAVRGQEIPECHRPGNNPRSALVDPTGRQLLVAHQNGLDRRLITFPEAAGGPRIGPAQTLLKLGPGIENRACLAADGRTLAFGDYAGGQAVILDLETREPKALSEGHEDIARIAISPDARWVAGVAGLKGVRVWDRQTGAVSKDFPSGGAATFSPDSQWLVIATPDGYFFWKVDSWEPGPDSQPGSADPYVPPAFNPKDKMLAVAHKNRSVRLVDTATGQEIATLTAPDAGVLSWLCFSPDGTQLAVAAENHTIQLWDLGLIRRQLAAMKLDW